MKEWMAFTSFSRGQMCLIGCLRARFSTLALFNGCSLFPCVWVQINSSLLVATLYLGPMRSLWTYVEGVDVSHLPFIWPPSWRPKAQIWPPWPGLALWPSLKDVCSSSMCWQFPTLSACCNIVFGTHEEPLGIY